MNKEEVLRVFENLTIAQLRKLTEEFLINNPDFPTALQLLNKLHRNKEAEKIRSQKIIKLYEKQEYATPNYPKRIKAEKQNV